MKIDFFTVGLNIVDVHSADDSAVEAICSEAENFLRGGGTISLQDWLALSESSRAAFVRASDIIWRERAGLFGIASQSPAGALAVSDEQAALDQAAMNANESFSTKLAGKDE